MERSEVIAASVIFRPFEIDEENVKCHHIVEYLQQLYSLGKKAEGQTRDNNQTRFIVILLL